MTGGTPIPCSLTPLDVLVRWPAERSIAMLHSGRVEPRWARYSIIAQPQGCIRFDGRHFHRPGTSPIACDDPFEPLQACWDEQPDVLWLGYLGYDLGRWVETLPSTAEDAAPWPILQFERCPGWLVYDVVPRQWSGFGTWADGAILRELSENTAEPHVAEFVSGPAQPRQRRGQFEANIDRVLEYIAAGDAFQVNLAQSFSGTFTGNTRSLFHRLAERSPAWYGAYLELSTLEPGEPARTLASISPELFLQCDAKGTVTTRPIKGSLPADQAEAVLRDSEKDAAELAMIVDLMRNDLGRVCRIGSVRVPESRAIENHPTIHHGVATITGELAPGRTLIDLLRATLPGGSITGAPKVRAMQIIEELEPHRRGPYCGAIGYVHGNTAKLNIAIRTLLLEQDRRGGTGVYRFSVGGGIVADSTPAAEYDETLAKAQALLKGLNPTSPFQVQEQAQQ